MRRFSLDGNVDAAAELEALLEHNGFRYRRDGDRYRLWFTDRGMKWETACICRPQAVVVYGIYPFPVQDRESALSLCGEVNGQVLYGGMFPAGETLVFRTCADLFDAYDAYESIARAIEYNCNVMTWFWHRMCRCAQPRAPVSP